MSAESRLKELNLELPPPRERWVSTSRSWSVGGLAYLSGHGPIGVDGTAICGRLGDDLDVKAGYEAARRTAPGGRFRRSASAAAVSTAFADW